MSADRPPTGLAACWRFDGGPARALVAAMLDAAGGRGQHHRIWSDGPVALGQLHRAAPGEPGADDSMLAGAGRADPGPLVTDPDGVLSVALHGRLHDRAPVARRLGVPADDDGRLLLAAYRRWGPDLLDEVDGDLATVIWDGRRRRLVAVADHLGHRPLVWWRGDRCVLVASEPAQLTAHPGFDPRPDEGVLAELYANRLTTTGVTPLAGVHRVDAGRVLVVEAGGRAREHRWAAPEHPRPPHRRTADWVATYGEALAGAVGRSLDGPDPATVTVSGGLDSSSILCLAARDGRLASGSGAVTFALHHPGADDPRYVRAVSRESGVPVTILDPRPYDWARTLAVTRDRFWVPIRPNAALHRTVIDDAAGRGRPVVLTGEGGDEWLDYQWRTWPDRLRRGQVDLVVRAALARPGPGRRRLPAAGRLVAQRALGPLVGRPAIPTLTGAGAVPPWLAPAFARRVALADRLSTRPGTDHRGPVRPARFALELGGIEIEAAAAGIEYRHPFYDRQLTETVLTMPEELLHRRGTTKWVLREAMADVLPVEVARRRDKGHFDPFVHRVVLELVDGVGGIDGLDRLAGVRRGYLDLTALRSLAARSLACVRDGRRPSSPSDNVNSLWAVFAADIWLAVRTGEEPLVPPNRTDAALVEAAPATRP